MRQCRHKYKQKMVHSGSTVCANIFTCSKCGYARRELTEAGMQQLNWWGLAGVQYGSAIENIYAGEYPPVQLVVEG